MRPVLALAAAASATIVWSAARGARADEAPRGPTQGFEFGARIGYSLPLGQVSGSGTTSFGGTTYYNTGRDLSDNFTGGLPLMLDVGYRIIPNVYVGGFVSYSFLFINQNVFGSDVGCNAMLSCSAHRVDLGANVQVHVLPDRTIDPWLGLGFGYEWVTVDLSESGQSGSVAFSGFQFVNFQVGLDYKPDAHWGVGPFVMLGMGEYDGGSESAGGVSQSIDLQDSKALHEWLTFGVRGVYDVGPI
jgi:hypothetical protein